MMENTELMITTKRIPESFKPIKRIANGIHAILGNDCRPTARVQSLSKILKFHHS